jgi:hypothetical protein
LIIHLVLLRTYISSSSVRKLMQGAGAELLFFQKERRGRGSHKKEQREAVDIWTPADPSTSPDKM